MAQMVKDETSAKRHKRNPQIPVLLIVRTECVKRSHSQGPHVHQRTGLASVDLELECPDPLLPHTLPVRSRSSGHPKAG